MPTGIYIRTPEHLAKMSASMKGKNRGPQSLKHIENKHLVRVGLKWGHHTGETKAAQSRANKSDWDGITPMLGTKRYSNTVTEEQFWALVMSQDHNCFLCAKSLVEGGALCIDHDHKTGDIRGVAHRSCNAKFDNSGCFTFREKRILV